MNIQDVKNIITKNEYSGQFIIFWCEDTPFIPQQYIEKLIADNNLQVSYSHEIDQSIITSTNMFKVADSFLRVYDIESFDGELYDIRFEKYLFIICRKLINCDSYKDYIVEVPKIEPWQLKDFAYSVADGVNETELDELISACGNDIYRLNSEIDKIKLFPQTSRSLIFQQFKQDGIFNDITDLTIFDLSTAIIQKDVEKLKQIYLQLDRIDVNPLALVNILYQNFKDIIKIQLGKNATPESTGIARNKFFAITYNNLNFYTSNQLISIFEMLTSIDYQLKTGVLDADLIIDYIIVNIFSC